MIQIIKPDNIIQVIKQIEPPTDKQLKEWIGCDYLEIVNVFFNGEYEQLIVDETGALPKDKIVNQLATDIYHENTRVHRPAAYNPKEMPSVYGTVVLLTQEHKIN